MKRFQVQVEGKATQTFDTADEAVRYAMHHVYLAPTRVQDMVDLLIAGKIAEYCYGFSGVAIVPIDLAQQAGA